MKVLYCNPVFFEYRLPFYKELVRLFKGDFYVMYSPVRYKMCNKISLCDKIQKELGKNAIPLTTDHLFDTNSMKWDVMPDIEKGKRIPFTSGLKKAIKKINPDILITEGYFQWTPLVLMYAYLHHTPIYMYYERTCWTERNTGFLKNAQRKLFNKFFTGFIVNGVETSEYLQSLGVCCEKIHIGGMAADAKMLSEKVKQFKQTDEYHHSVAGRKGIEFLFTGVVAERKGIMYLLQAWKQHIIQYPQDTLVVVGDGNQMKECLEFCKNVNGVSFVGKIPYGQIYKYYACADVYILPTIEDNWSLVIPEAMSCGLPVATSIYNGCHKELVHDGINGFVFDTFKQETIVAVLDKFHHSNLVQMGQESIVLEKPFNTENCAARFFQAINTTKK